MQPAISIIVPVYNVEKWIEDCLQSIEEQSFGDFEMICLDDCSTDGSWSIVERYASLDPRIKLYRNDRNRGLSYTRNRGMSLASGKYILFVDSDDMIVSDTLDVVFDRAEKDQSDIVFFDYRHLFEGDVYRWQKADYINYNGLYGIYNGKKLFTKLEKEKRFEVPACFKLYRKDFLVDKGLVYYEKILQEDSLFSFLCMMEAERVSCVDRELYIYRKRPGGITNTEDELRAQSFFLVFCEVIKYWNSHSLDAETSEAVRLYANKLFTFYIVRRDNNIRNMELPFGSDAEKFVYELFSSMKGNSIMLSKADWERIAQSEEIYIYGAGKIGREMFCELANRRKEVCAFIVSAIQDDVRTCLGKKIIPINEFEYDDNKTIIIAVSGMYKEEIIHELERRNYNNYLTI